VPIADDAERRVVETICLDGQGSVALLQQRLSPPKASDDSAKPGPKVGDRMTDGTVYAGTSPDTGKAMYATPGDAPLTCTFNQARNYAAELDAHDHNDWRVPTKDELNVMFQNLAAIGGFNETGSPPGGWYWSSSEVTYFDAWGQRFSDGDQSNDGKNVVSSLRLVR